MIERWLEPHIVESMKYRRVVHLTGARQTGNGNCLNPTTIAPNTKKPPSRTQGKGPMKLHKPQRTVETEERRNLLHLLLFVAQKASRKIGSINEIFTTQSSLLTLYRKL